MTIKCLTAGRMTMSATLLHQNDPYNPGEINPDQFGTWVDSQDPLYGQIVKKWVPYPAAINNPTPPWLSDGTRREDVDVYPKIPCVARGIVDGGIRVAGTTERFGDTYENIDFAKMWIPANVAISKRDRVTNISDPRGRVVWVDEEFIDPRTTATPAATVFNVNGVTPLFDAFNRHVESFVLLERISVPQA